MPFTPSLSSLLTNANDTSLVGLTELHSGPGTRFYSVGVLSGRLCFQLSGLRGFLSASPSSAIWRQADSGRRQWPVPRVRFCCTTVLALCVRRCSVLVLAGGACVESCSAFRAGDQVLWRVGHFWDEMWACARG